jgi:hypothetical protein
MGEGNAHSLSADISHVSTFLLSPRTSFHIFPTSKTLARRTLPKKPPSLIS